MIFIPITFVIAVLLTAFSRHYTKMLLWCVLLPVYIIFGVQCYIRDGIWPTILYVICALLEDQCAN